MVSVGFEVTDTVCELVLKVVVAASLVSFSSFADEASVSVVFSEAVVVVVTGLDSVSSTCPQPDSSKLHIAKIVIIFFIAFTPKICFLNYSIKTSQNPDFAEKICLFYNCNRKYLAMFYGFAKQN